MARLSAFVASVVIAAGVAAGCGNTEPSESRGVPLADFASEGASESEVYSDIDSMVAKADLSVVGTFSELVGGPNESIMQTARAIVSTRAGGKVEVAFVLGTAASAEATFAELRTALPKGEAVWVLRRIPVYKDVFRPVNQAAIIERAPDGKSQPAFYRATAAAMRDGGQNDDLDHADLIRELGGVEFEALAAKLVS